MLIFLHEHRLHARATGDLPHIACYMICGHAAPAWPHHCPVFFIVVDCRRCSRCGFNSQCYCLHELNRFVCMHESCVHVRSCPSDLLGISHALAHIHRCKTHAHICIRMFTYTHARICAYTNLNQGTYTNRNEGVRPWDPSQHLDVDESFTLM